jgi:mycoredoxin
VPLTMYTTTWCGFCKNLKRQLAKVGIEMTEVDIERDPEAAEFVMSVNGGNQTVPTVLFPDGSTLCNPSAAQVQKKLGELASTASRPVGWLNFPPPVGRAHSTYSQHPSS